jgi:hypothetical protein
MINGLDWQYVARSSPVNAENGALPLVKLVPLQLRFAHEVLSDEYASKRASHVAGLRWGASRVIVTSIGAKPRPRAGRLWQTLVKACPQEIGLLAESESTDRRSVALDVLVRQIGKEPPPLSHQLQ